MPDSPKARIVERDGQPVLEDPGAVLIPRVKCLRSAQVHRERIAHFVGRARDLGRGSAEVIITVLNGDDAIGARVAALLMPAGWDTAFRADGVTPFARGLAEREGLQQLLDAVAPHEGRRLRAIEGMAVLVADHDYITAFPVELVLREGA